MIDSKARKLFFLFITFFISQNAFAILPSMFPVSPNDESSKILGIVFGGSVGSVAFNAGTANPVLQTLFERFNTVVMTLGIIILSYTSTLSIANTAQDGSPLGKKWSSVWAPMKTAFGLTILIPSATSGYSIVQSMVVWVVVQGIGAANAVWDVIVDGLSQGDAVASISGRDYLKDEIINESPGIDKMAQNILRAQTCIEGLRHLYTFRNDPSIETSSMVSTYGHLPTVYIDSIKRNDENPEKEINLVTNYNVGINSSPDPYLRNMCGTFKLTTTIKKDTDDPLNLERDLKGLAEKIHATKSLAFTNVFSILRSVATTITRDKNIKDNVDNKIGDFLTRNKGGLASAVDAYARQLVGLTRPLASSSDPVFDDMKSQGWIFASSYYKKMTNATQNLSLYTTIKSELPIKGDEDFPKPGNLTDGLDNLSLEEKSYFKAFLGAAELYISKNDSLQKHQSSLQVNAGGVNASALFSILESFMSGFEELKNPNSKEEPLFQIGKIGKKMMLNSEIALFSTVALLILMYSLAGILSGISPAKYVLETLTYTIVFAMIGFFIMMWSTGATLGLYVPMIPYLIFTITSLGWVFSVVEAVIGAPIMALGLILPSQDETGKIIPGLQILLNIFLRPTLMLFGFVLSIRLFATVVKIINASFFNYALSLPGVTQSALGLGIIIVIISYVSLLQSSASMIFALIYLVPNSISKYGGAHADQFDVEGVLQEIETKSQQGISAVSDVQKGAADKAFSSGMKQTDKKREDKKKSDKGSGGGGGGGSE